MSVRTIEPRHRLSGKSAALGLAGMGIAVGAALGLAAVQSNESTPTAPAQQLPTVVDPDGVRDSWEGRIGPEAGRPEKQTQHSADVLNEKLERIR